MANEDILLDANASLFLSSRDEETRLTWPSFHVARARDVEARLALGWRFTSDQKTDVRSSAFYRHARCARSPVFPATVRHYRWLARFLAPAWLPIFPSFSLFLFFSLFFLLRKLLLN